MALLRDVAGLFRLLCGLVPWFPVFVVMWGVLIIVVLAWWVQ